MLKDEQKSAKTLPQRLAGLNKGCGAWGENLACGVARQGVFLGRSGAWQSVVNSATHNTAWRGEFDNETAQRGKIQQHGNKIQRNKFSVASVCGQNSARLHDKFGLASVAKWAVLAGEVGKAKMEQCLGGGPLSLSLSLVARTLWHAFGLNLKGFFTHFVVISSRFILDFAHFIAISSYLVVNFSYSIAVFPRLFVVFSHLFAAAFRFIIVLTHLFACKRHFLGPYAFLKFLMLCFWVFYACHC